MDTKFNNVEKQARALTRREKADLARILLEDLDKAVDTDSEQLWLQEAQSRYDLYRAGQMPAHAGDEVMRRVRNRLK